MFYLILVSLLLSGVGSLWLYYGFKNLDPSPAAPVPFVWKLKYGYTSILLIFAGFALAALQFSFYFFSVVVAFELGMVVGVWMFSR